MSGRAMTIRYCCALVIVAITASVGYGGIRWSAGQVGSHESAMQQLSVQQTWAREVVEQAEDYVKADTPAERARVETTLLDTLDRLAASQEKLNVGAVDGPPIDMADPDVQRAYFDPDTGLDDLMREFEEEVRELIALEAALDIDETHPQARLVFEELPRKLLAQMNAVVLMHKAESAERVDQSLTFGGFLVAAVIVILLLEGIFIFRPMVRAIVENQHALEEANDRLERLATYDPLTQVYNRTKFPEISHRERARARREKAPLGCIMLDIDHFKKVNDTHGHAVGDEVLQHVSGILRSETRGVDYVIRWGGEEFLILLPGNNGEAARAAAEKLRQRIETAPVRDDLAVTISLGTTETDGSEPLVEVIERADGALYRAKENGRNRVVAAAEVAT